MSRAPDDEVPFGPSTVDVDGSDLLDHDVVWFPIRHHSPACARRLDEVLRSRRPAAVLIEAPRTFADVISLLADPDTRYPVAVFSHRTVAAPGLGERRDAAYFPLCDYSPETVALRVGTELGADVRFIDLDDDHLVGVRDVRDAGAFSAETHFAFNDTLQAAARRAGCRDHNDLWDRLFETTDRSLSDFVRSVHAYGALARSTTPPERLEADGTLLREAVMAAEIHRARRDHGPTPDRPIVVVTGAFHTPALRELSTGEVVEPELPDLSIRDSGRYLVRYGFEQLDALNGYASGMPSPAWYQQIWDLGSAPSDADRLAAVLDTLSAVAAEVRVETRSRALTSTPSMIAALQQAEGLRRLRGGQRPARTDVIDAATSCFVAGDIDTEGRPVLKALRQVLTGDRLGRVPAAAGRPPIAVDFEERCADLRLPTETTTSTRVQLEIHRTASHRAKSRLLHGLTFLEVPYARWESGPRHSVGVGSGLLRETWECRAGPATDVGLVEASRWGATVADAVAERYVSATADLENGEAPANAVAMHLVRAAELGVHDAVPRVATLLQQRAIVDPSLESVTRALTELQLTWTARSAIEGQRIDPLPDLIQTLFHRSCALVDQLQAGVGDEGATVDSLLLLRGAIADDHAVELDGELLWSALDRLDRPRLPPRLAGATLGLLWSVGGVDDRALADDVAGRAVGGGDDIGAFLDGVLRTAREALWQVAEVLVLLSDLFTSWDDDAFLRRLPALRSAFAALTPRETDRIAELVGSGPTTVVVEQDEAALLRNLERDRLVTAALDADGFGWGHP